jgi:hypothetical protein
MSDFLASLMGRLALDDEQATLDSLHSPCQSGDCVQSFEGQGPLEFKELPTPGALFECSICGWATHDKGAPGQHEQHSHGAILSGSAPCSNIALRQTNLDKHSLDLSLAPVPKVPEEVPGLPSPASPTPDLSMPEGLALKPEPAKLEITRPDPSKAESPKSEPPKTEPANSGPTKPEPPKPQPPETDPKPMNPEPPKLQCPNTEPLKPKPPAPEAPVPVVTFECNQCERLFGSQRALDQHIEDSPAHAYECVIYVIEASTIKMTWMTTLWTRPVIRSLLSAGHVVEASGAKTHSTNMCGTHGCIDNHLIANFVIVRLIAGTPWRSMFETHMHTAEIFTKLNLRSSIRYHTLFVKLKI